MSLEKKLKLTGRKKPVVVNAPPGYDLGVATKISGQHDWIQLFVKNKAELEKSIAKVAAALAPDAMLWISFPKGSSKIQTDLTRDKGWDAIPKRDLKWITLVSVDDTWSAFGLRPYKEGEARQEWR
jgi:hypothetical protein